MSAEIDTQAVIQRVLERLEQGDVEHVVVATTSGRTAVQFADVLDLEHVHLICVTHHAGFRTGDEVELEPEYRSRLAHCGAQVLTTGHALSGVGRGISKAFGGTTPLELIAHTLRLFGQGMKVCVEIAAMAADAGLVPTTRDVLCVAGTGRGADTAVVLKAAHGSAFFETRVREILCLPEGA
jgi:hypothetical protein